MVLILPLAVAGGVSNTIIQSATTKSVTRQEVGGILGITASLEAVTRVIAPIAGGYLLQNLGVWAPGIFSVILMGWTIVLAYWRIIRPARREKLAEESSLMKTAIWWIRRDLRLSDNQALAAALHQAEVVIPVFILDPKLLESPLVSQQRLAFLFDGLRIA